MFGGRGGGEHCFTRLARHVDRRRAVGISEAFGVQQPRTGTLARANNYQRAMRGAPTQLLVFPCINRSRRELGDENAVLLAAQRKCAGQALGAGGGSVEQGHSRDAFAIEFEVAGDRFQPIKRR